MPIQRQVYKSSKTKKSLVSVIVSGCKSPILPVKFCNLVKPFYYPNSPTIARYSIATKFCPKENSEFLKTIQTIEQNENVASIIKNDSIKENGEYLNTGKLIIKFQTKNKIPVFVINKEGEDPLPLDLADEFSPNTMVQVVFDVLRYTKKNIDPPEYGISFKPTKVFYYPQISKEKEVSNGDS